MTETLNLDELNSEFGLCEIRIKGHIDERWADRFDDAVITLEEDGNTLLICPVTDQAALHGLLKKVRDLGMSLISVNFINSGQTKPQEVQSKNFCKFVFHGYQSNKLIKRKKE